MKKNRGNILEMQYGFCSYALFVDCPWLAVARSFTKNSRKVAMWLFGASLWKIIKVLWLVKYSSKFVFIHRRCWNSECSGLWYALVFEMTTTGWLDLVHWHRQAPSPTLWKVCRILEEGQHFVLLIQMSRWDENQIFLRIFVFKHWYLRVYLFINRMVTS